MRDLLVWGELGRLEHGAWSDGSELVVYSARSPAKTTENEDSALVLELPTGRAIVAVADGVGGHPGGEQASRAALQALRKTANARLAAGAALREAILSGFDRANEAVLELGTGGATTLVVLEVDGPQIRAYHAGDSGALVFGGRGRRKLETLPHSLVGYGIEAGLIPEEQALEHEDRHIICNVVGDREMHIAISRRLVLSPRDTVVLASDGLFDNVAIDDVVELLRKGNLKVGVEQLVALCHERMASGGHPDDLTLIALRRKTEVE